MLKPTSSSGTEAAILIVDDHPPNLMALEEVLKTLERPVVLASSGGEALARLATRDFALVVMDAVMPRLDGYETVARLRREERMRDVPVIFLTALADAPEHHQRGYALGAIDFIAKPFDPDVLRGKVRSIIALYERGLRIERERNLKIERMKDLFFGAVGHDLRSPLTTISMAAQILVTEEQADPSRAPLGGRIQRAVARMNGIIDDILDLTAGQFADGLTVSAHPMELDDVTSGVISELRAAHPLREIELRAEGDLRGRWDPRRLARAVSNLVGNAIQHGVGNVTVSVIDEGAWVALRVHNWGEPIRAEILTRLFEPFRRGESSAMGHGLGLFIVREIVRAHGGTVGVTSSEEEGTTFAVRLPRRSGG
jgi:signal transduction histidine kinase